MSSNETSSEPNGTTNNATSSLETNEDWDYTTAFEDSVAKPSREAIHNFFYPPQRDDLGHSVRESTDSEVQQEFDQHFEQQETEDKQFVERFWTTYDDIIILSIFTQIGIVFRLASATWFKYFDNVFSNDSALFVNLPLNSLSCFIMGLLCSGERLMEIISTRFSPPRLQQTIQRDQQEKDGTTAIPPSSSLRRRRTKQEKYFHHWEPPVHLNEELRDVQILALERRIRQSKCLLLFPVKKQDIDVMEHYFQEGFKREDEDDNEKDFDDLILREGHMNDDSMEEVKRKSEPLKMRTENETIAATCSSNPTNTSNDDSLSGSLSPRAKSDDEQDHLHEVELAAPAPPESSDAPIIANHDLNQIMTDVSANVTENITRLRRVNLTDGWDQGTTPEAMSDDLMLGLRDGFCGALSSFSSWNSAMINLMRGGKVGTAMVGYMLGLQLPIIAYRFGQHVAVYIFIWRCRRETKRDERRGYGIRLSMNETSERDDDGTEDDIADLPSSPHSNGIRPGTDRELPSVRAIFTALFIMALVTQCTSLSFFGSSENQQIALSLLFSPLGVLARWRLSKYNNWRPGFPLGTFISNILACALSGGLGELLAGDPGPQERIVLQSFINGFGGTLSSVAAFIIETLAGIDPILFRFDGVFYAVLSIFWAMVVGFIFSASVDWADQTQ